MSYCSNCIHYKVCGNEGVDDSAMTFCADKQISGDLISRQAVLDLAKDLTFEGGCKHRCIDVTEVYHLPSAEKTASEKLEDIIVGYEIQNIYDLLTKHTALLNDIKMTLTSGKQNNSVLEDIKAEIESICENSTYPPDDTFFREVIDEDYFFGLKYAYS